MHAGGQLVVDVRLQSRQVERLVGVKRRDDRRDDALQHAEPSAVVWGEAPCGCTRRVMGRY